MADLSKVPLANLVLRAESGAEVPLSSILPIALEYRQHDTIQSALERAVSPWKLTELGAEDER